METGISLAEVAEAWAMAEPGMLYLLNTRTGAICTGTEDNLIAAECNGEAELPLWERELVMQLREALNSPDWIQIPTRTSSRSYRLLESYAYECAQGELHEALIEGIVGPGAFGRFREIVRAHGKEQEWYEFRDRATRDEAEEWLKEQGIGYRE